VTLTRPGRLPDQWRGADPVPAAAPGGGGRHRGQLRLPRPDIGLGVAEIRRETTDTYNLLARPAGGEQRPALWNRLL